MRYLNLIDKAVQVRYKWILMIFLGFQSHIKANSIMKATRKFLLLLLLILWSYNASSSTLADKTPPDPPMADTYSV